jgi:endonuclease/exonuclease/phosphatase family metal-dependent hydrolase
MKNILIFALLWLTFSIFCCTDNRNEISEYIDIRIMSFNIRYGTASDGENQWDHRKDLVFNVIRQYSPDVLGLQEALRFQIDEIRKIFPEYGEIGEGRHGGTEGEYSPILYRIEKFGVDESKTFWLSDTPEIPSTHWGNSIFRICTWGRLIDRQSEIAFYMYNTHLDHQSQPSREMSVQLIIDVIKNRKQKDPFALAGDFNAGEENRAILYVKGKRKVKDQSPLTAVDSFRLLYPAEKNVGTFNGFKGITTGEKIDYIFVTPGTNTLEASIVRTEKDGRFPSDHFPVTAMIRIP